jgi:hypothetical protein
MMPDAPTQPNTATTTLTEYILPSIFIDYKHIDTYLTEIGALDKIVEALDRVACLAQHAQGIENVIQKLQYTVKQIQPLGAMPATTQHSYTAAVQKGIAQPSPSLLLSKPVLICHKHKIIVVQGKETNTQKIRTYKEIIEQVNTKDIAGEAIAVCKLPSSNIVLAMDSKQACTSWLAN